MDDKGKDNVFYVCTMIEYVARLTKNRRKDIVNKMSKKDIEREIKDAEVNHCLSYEQVADEWIERYKIESGEFDTIQKCRYKIPSTNAIGRVYQQLVLETARENEEAQAVIDVFSSFLSDEISDFNTNVYYSNPDYLRCSYEAGVLLA